MNLTPGTRIDVLVTLNHTNGSFTARRMFRCSPWTASPYRRSHSVSFAAAEQAALALARGELQARDSSTNTRQAGRLRLRYQASHLMLQDDKKLAAFLKAKADPSSSPPTPEPIAAPARIDRGLGRRQRHPAEGSHHAPTRRCQAEEYQHFEGPRRAPSNLTSLLKEEWTLESGLRARASG